MELYIHIPFCIRKCAYCDFLSGPADEKTQDRYMEALLREVALAGKQNDKQNNENERAIVDTIFIGGGTPTAVNARWIVRLMERVRASFAVGKNAEITMEANPGTLTGDKLAQYHQAGINRLSMGLQSADDGELARLGRIHTFQEFLENYRLAREAGFTNINIDLMSALPGQTVESYERTLRRIIALEPEHISAYSLIIEEGTPFGDRYLEQSESVEDVAKDPGTTNTLAEKDLWLLPTEEEDRQMYHLTKEILAEAGYERYETSNYSRSGYECRHNVGYWTGVPYLGLGLGAASYYRGQRFSNTRILEEYLTNLNLQTGQGQQDREENDGQILEKLRKEMQTLSVEDRMEEFMFLGLRLTKGISSTVFSQWFGKKIEDVYGPVLENMEKQGLMESCWIKEKGSNVDLQEQKYWRLTDLGQDVSNVVLAEFLF